MLSVASITAGGRKQSINDALTGRPSSGINHREDPRQLELDVVHIPEVQS